MSSSALRHPPGLGSFLRGKGGAGTRLPIFPRISGFENEDSDSVCCGPEGRDDDDERP